MADEIQQLKTDIALNQTIVIVGSGVSFSTTNGEQDTAHWRGLLRNGLVRCHQLRSMTDGDFESFTKKFDTNTATTDDYLSAANRIKDTLKRKSSTGRDDAYQSWLFETIGKLVAKKLDFIQTIAELECPILTTNYDSLLADVLGRKSITWNEYCNDNSLEDMHNHILHLHGHFHKPDTIVFSSGDYKRLRQNCSGLSKLRGLLKAKTLLFIGYDTGVPDPQLSNLLKWISQATEGKPLSIYRLMRSSVNKQLYSPFDMSFTGNIKAIPYGATVAEFLSFLKGLKSFTPLMRDNLLFKNKKELIRQKYLTYLIKEYGHISIFGYSNTNINLPLESVYVELKFDPTHPSIKAMQTVEIHEEFKRKFSSPGFFDENERNKILQAILERNASGSQTIYRDFMIDQWLSVFLYNENIFTTTEAMFIEQKIRQLKHSIMEKNSFQEIQQYRIQQAYQEFKHFVVLGHPGAGKTTLSKWLVMNIAKQCLGEENMLFDQALHLRKKIPILIPIWKYVDQSKQNSDGHKQSLLQFISQNPTCSSSFFNDDERKDLSSLIIESLIQGNVLIILEGLDEVPAHVDRTDLMKEINMLLERGIDYDSISHQLTYSIYEQKEINNIKDPHTGNRFIITSRIEGNYFEDINYYIPRLTIENMSNEALRLFCRSYIQSIQQMSGQLGKQDESDRLYNDISQNKDIFQLAINPQLASVITALYHQCDGQLPERRIDLYDRAIETVIERLLTPGSHLGKELGLNSTLLWSILQEIAEYLHSRVEGLSEKVLRDIIQRCFIEQESSVNLEDLIPKVVNIFKYQAGLLNEFGQNSFRFIHRTFQEYLAAKSMIYSNGKQRSETTICENIINKIGIPNWRVPLSMTFGILSKSMQETDLFNTIIKKLLVRHSTTSDTRFSNLLLPFVVIDSLNDMSFSSKEIENQLIQNLADLLLLDYRDLAGFARLKEHRELINSYFSKLKRKYESPMAEWFIEKLHHSENAAACANVIYQLRWYRSEFHELFLRNLHHDSIIWNWPIDSLLRFYSNEAINSTVLTKLNCRDHLSRNAETVDFITKNHDWLRVIIAVYGGYENYDTRSTIEEYHETSQFLSLSDKQRSPFLYYYQEIWGRENTSVRMAVHINTLASMSHWTVVPSLDISSIYKDSFLTDEILQLLLERQSAMTLIEWLRMQISTQTLSMTDKINGLIALIALGDFHSIKTVIEENDRRFIECFGNRIEQLICSLKDPIARWATRIPAYLLTAYDQMKGNETKYDVNFINYCKMYLSLSAESGGERVNTKEMLELIDNVEDKCYLSAEYWASAYTGAGDNTPYKLSSSLDDYTESGKGNEIIRSFLKINEATQIYKPIPSYAWPLDIFIFRWINEDDIPIAFFNCLENINSNLTGTIESICDILIEHGYFRNNPQLVPLVTLFNLGIMSKDLDSSDIIKTLVPELAEQSNKKQFLLEKIQSMSDPYYKSRALYQLAQLYDQKSYELLCEAFVLVEQIATPVLKFQVLEKIFAVVHYKNVEETSFIRQIVDALVMACEQIDDHHDQTIASIRLSFYGSDSFRHKCLTRALQTLMNMNGDDQQIKLIIKIKPLIALFDDLRVALNEFIQNMTNKTHQYLAQCRYGKILSSEKSTFHTTEDTDVGHEYIQLEAFFSLYAQLKDVKSMIGIVDTIDQLWINLFKDPLNPSNVTKILEIGLKKELFLTPQVAIILDELIRQGNENSISMLFPYIIKPSNEVLPVVQRWLTDYHDKPIGKLAALLLTEVKNLFESGVDILTDLLRSDNDQMRYRAQRVFQHPDRDVNEPSKRISVIGERTLIKIFENMHINEQFKRVRTYMSTLFYDLLWDDPEVYSKLYEYAAKLKNVNKSEQTTMRFFNRITFLTTAVWDTIMTSFQSSLSHTWYVEELFHSVMILAHMGAITEDNWIAFARVLSNVDTSQFKDALYFSLTDVQIVQFIVDEICVLPTVCDETYFEILESKLLSLSTVPAANLSQHTYHEINLVARNNFFFSIGLNNVILTMLSNIPLNSTMMENLIKWLVQQMINFQEKRDYSLILSDCLLSLTAACVQKDDYLYRKITNAPYFNKLEMTKLLEKIIQQHRFTVSRGSAFILLAALDQTDHKVIINAMNTLFDENPVKDYAMIGMPLIHLSPNALLDDLLESLKCESAVKTYEILKIFTQFALNETIDADGKTKIINYLANEIEQLKSKRPINYYYTDIRIPFTTTLETELYKAWVKIQGLSGKTLYSTALDTSS